MAVAVTSDGFIAISSRETAMKIHNVRRDPAVSICVISDEFFGRWIQLDGIAEVRSLPEVMDQLVEYYRSVAGEHTDWDDYRAAMTSEQRVLLVITPIRAGPDRSG